MKILEIIVNELPKNCGECYFLSDRYYCKIKGSASGQQFVDRYAGIRDKDCPLKGESLCFKVID